MSKLYTLLNTLIGKVNNSVKTDTQTLSAAQKTQARENIGAVAKNQGAENVGKILVVGTDGNLVLVDMPEGGTSGDVVGTLDDSNNILLNGSLADGTYTLKWLMSDGTYSDAGTLTVGEIPEVEEIVNQIPISIDSSGAVYNGIGYKNNVRLKSDGVTEEAITTKSCALTGYIPVSAGDIIRLKNISLADGNDTTEYISYLRYYNASFTMLKSYGRSSTFTTTYENGIHTFTVASDVEGVVYMRLQVVTLDDTSVVTVNQEIT